ncbi:uncharacterized protein LOC113867557 [Abrus precatorius]|uniref:Uncharacterized protein LOC113867557 n=1 Tax=Abrus precatorius TaxID=3816 RepID=A0A8B8LR36_ABRPR|nr:uncharacterized protein LOC113867557 [Abrus precatorius]XP_027358750.1 uncharacterized protein LOC113867557 [Abrus precatorius]
MNIQVAASQPGIYTKNVSHLRHFHSRPCTLPMVFNPLCVTSLSIGAKPSSVQQCLPILKFRQPLHVCLAGGQGMMENNGDSQRKALEKAMEQLKGQSIEDMLRQQMQKGGSGGKPPGGRGGGGSGSSPGGSDEGGFTGMSDETLQIVLATVCFLFLYMFVINGLELAKLTRDFIKFLSGGGQSVRLKRATYKWVRLYKNITEKKEVDKNGLEKKAPTWWFNPDFFRGVLRHHMKSNSDE